MAFAFCDRMIHQYRTQGYVIFRQIIPASLLKDLRRATARVHDIARTRSGPQAQRLQPLNRHLSPEELKPVYAYAELPPLVDAIQKVLTPRHRLSNGLDRLGVLLEPAEKPWVTAWHRDIRATSNVPDVEEFLRVTVDPLWFNQVNCPLYEDGCTWFVPGSHLRTFDLPGETAAASASIADVEGYEERERAGVEYCQAMPGAIRAAMDAGDFMLYNPNAWHLGNYLPDRKRVTLHDWAPNPELIDWYDRWGKAQKAKAEQDAKAAAKA